MKKVVVLISAMFLFASFSFAQTPQTQSKDTKAAPAKKEVKGQKTGCDKKDAKNCSKAMDPKSGCCAKDKAKSEKKTETAPETPKK